MCAELADLEAGLDLACIALYVVCALENTVRLGDLVVDNLLYQVAKKYAEIPKVGVVVNGWSEVFLCFNVGCCCCRLDARGCQLCGCLCPRSAMARACEIVQRID